MTHENIRFDRSLCAEPCGKAHCYDEETGRVADPCVWDPEEIPFEIVSARMTIAKRLMRERRHANLTHAHMAERLYIAVSEYRTMETTAFPFTWLLVKRLADVLGVEASNLAPEYCALTFHTE